MHLTVTLHTPGESNYEAANLQRAYELWSEVQTYFAKVEHRPFIRDQAQTAFWQLGVDVTDLLETLSSQITVLKTGVVGVHDGQGDYRKPTIKLELIPGGSAGAGEFPHRAIERFLEQLFLAANLARPGTCDMSTLRYEKRRRQVELSSDILDDARYDSQQIGWPNLRHLPFAAVWNWLHEERYYDVDLVTRPSHKALTLVLQICSGPQWNTANMLLLAQALEGIFVRGRRKDKTRYLANRICEALRLSPEAFEWFMEFYRLRSAFVHGELPIIRSGTELAWLMPEDQEFPHKAEFLEGRGTALLLAVLQELIETNRHDFVA